MEWYIWVIIGLSLALVGLSVLLVLFIRGVGKAFGELVVAPWVKGNFGKRNR